MKKKIRLEYIITGISLGILVLFLFSIGFRFCVRQILVKKLGIENSFTQLVFWDKPDMAVVAGPAAMGDEEGELEAVDIDWEKLYPFKKGTDVIGKIVPQIAQNALTPYVDRYASTIESLEVKVESYATDLLAGKARLTQWHENYDNLIHWRQILADADDDTKILYMENGYLTYVEPRVPNEDIEEIADSVLDFSDYLAGQGIAFYYINAGSKVNPSDKELSKRNLCLEFTNENGDALLAALSKRKVNFLDMRECMAADGLDWYGSYYKADHHWNTETGLWAAGVIAQMLNEKEGFKFDLAFFDENSYAMTRHEDCEFGGQGRAVTFAHADLEPYTCILPNFETDFSLEIPSRGVHLEGEYKDTLYDCDNLEAVLSYSQNDHLTQRDAYSSVAWKNDAMGIVKNKLAKENASKKILMLQDSFSYYSTTYLACDVGEIAMIHPEVFDGSIQSYVEEMQPDVVIAMYCERNINPIDWSRHHSMFDFR